ncbi:hypothetical protein BRADI_3g00476v3 [Brachypodium distachyon]|nr:hypothetical protein BRADI_3g00476v3 [Brachypodium distachyon]
MLSFVENIFAEEKITKTMLVECDMKKIRNQLCDFLMEELDASSSELVTSKLEECSLASSMSE